ncbi:Dopey, N-terminal-domain-containing protein [Mucidula mucida]|nr:Dopey, N-terminal-domain-containing protein [Mucidula mucida]
MSTLVAAAQQAYAADPKYKKYTQQVEKCLNSFDNVHEWADCIAFLKQLLKTFQSYMQFKEIPRKLIVAKRLSQCLNPALPTGVHQRALDVYAHILPVLGSEGLKRDLPLWSSGLFPFFEYAATSVKDGLRPVMKSFIIALLPGLEEETGEFFEKVLSLLDRLSGAVSQSFFFQNIWLIMLTTPSARGTALNLLARRLPHLTGDEDIISTIGEDMGLMIRAFAAALEDDNLLVRRGALDLLVQSLRLDGNVLKKAQDDDRTILMRAAVSVVLRRDLSLNRRLYTWLLGSDEKAETQLAYLKMNALGLLCATLNEDMSSPSDEYSESRPFKIFISLLDKWEIGAPLTDALVLDAFKALKGLIESGTDGAEDVTMTASTLYEAVEPPLLWKHVLDAVFSEILGTLEDCPAISLFKFLLKTFSQDEEIQTIHFPVIFASLVDILHTRLQDAEPPSGKCVQETLSLLELMIHQIPHVALLQRPEPTEEAKSATATLGPYAFTCAVYGITPKLSNAPIGSFSIPFSSSFENLYSLTTIFARTMSGANLKTSREALCQSLLLMSKLASRLGSTSIQVSWNPALWLSTVLECLGNESANFTTVDRTVSLVVVLCQAPALHPNIHIDERTTMYKMVSKLLRYLRPDFSPYHARSVSLIWSLESATKKPHVESILAQTMTSPESRNIQESYEAFGVLWRLTEDNMLPGFRFKVPMMIVLDTLKNDDPSLKRIGETWMRCSLKSYLRVLDPILFELLDPSIRRTPTTLKVRGKEIQGYLYERPFDQRYTHHLLEMLLSIIRFGGQGFAKTARGGFVKRSQHAGLVQRVEAAGFPDPDASYLEVLVELLLRFLQSEPSKNGAPTMHPHNAVIHTTSVELLQTIVARGEIDLLFVESIEAIVVGKLYYCVHLGRLDLQNKLLHVLHSLISASMSMDDPGRRAALTPKPRQGERPPELVVDIPPDTHGRGYNLNNLLIQTLVDGISVPTNRPVLQHWLDFILMAVPQFQPALQAVVAPLNDCICKQLHTALDDILQVAMKEKEFDDDFNSTVTDAECVMLLNGLERLVLISLAYTSEISTQEEDATAGDKSADSGGLLGYVQRFTEEQLTARSSGYRALQDAVRVLYSIWGSLSWTEREARSSRDELLALIFTRVRVRCRRVLEHLFRVQAAEVFEAIVDCWNKDVGTPTISEHSAFDLTDVLISNAQNAVHMMCESISWRVSGLERTRKQAVNPELSDNALFKFLELYMARLEGPIALQVWNRFLQLTKDIIGSGRDFKPQNYPTLRCLTEDRRIRKDLQETYGKLLDSCITFVGRSFDQGSWIRRTAKDALGTNGRDSPIPRAINEAKIDEKLNASVSSLPVESPRIASSSELIYQINEFVATSSVPHLRRFLIDNDKISTACSNIVYYIVGPAMKGKSRPMDVDTTTVAIIQEMSRIPAALKAWKAPVVELLNDNRLFNGSADVADQWKPIVRSLFDADKTAFPELLGKVATAPSTNIFTNREYEMLLRSLNLRRLSFVLFAGDKNHFLTQLPSIQEKLVDILKNVTAPIVQSEVYLCIRVLLCRLSPHNLTSFWPVILTELYRLFDQVMSSPPSDGSEDLQLMLSACKCLDLLFVLQTEEFQIHQWIFITDTVDAIYRPNDWAPSGMLDQLAEIVGSMPRSESQNGALFNSTGPDSLRRGMRRPLLNSIRQIESIRDLGIFFSNVSIASYESVYASGGNVDWEAVEQGIMDDLFDGR